MFSPHVLLLFGFGKYIAAALACTLLVQLHFVQERGGEVVRHKNTPNEFNATLKHYFWVASFLLVSIILLVLISYLRRHSVDPYGGSVLWKCWIGLHLLLDAIFSVVLIATLFERIALGARRAAFHRFMTSLLVWLFRAILLTGMTLLWALQIAPIG
ncbi:MAG TPA: hypothetical protein VMU13_02500 [Candidatus Paceibacterota bacterium]|nr:hypothetical protein [Candidatus Paceibacterota bacterium]